LRDAALMLGGALIGAGVTIAILAVINRERRPK
jgi:hypothetical protein